ncbi:hypothetical protein G9U51_15745 [Calidifontibacter sp. DB0510]|uniref:Uncharacterized protein n=1 Tax=Metallococcus carri TaxID=1656884 RepID=A0A967EBE4_9MICO|nr:hypothetical protein [Metallococcus carri]NHN57225.1 hypothetical protein [Metallococcus carri]NOP37972.1 hypothetical protein [Calidifontibacter sp. DB2511S]
MLRRWFLIMGLTVLAFAVATITWSLLQARPKALPVSQPGPLVVVSMPTLTYADTPNTRQSALWDLARDGAVGALATRSLTGHSCSLQSWLTFSAGARTSVGATVSATPRGQAPGTCPAPPAMSFDGAGAQFPQWEQWRQVTLGRVAQADIGKLGSTLAARGQCIMAAGPFAALGAADRTGRVARYTPDPANVDVNACPVTFISLDGPDDDYLRMLMRHLPPRSTIVVAGMADDTGPERLHAVVISGAGTPHGLLTSISTRQRGVITLSDLSALVLSRLGAGAPRLPEGRSPLVQPSGSPTAAVVRTTEITGALTQEYSLVQPFIVGFYAIVLAAFALGGIAWLIARSEPEDSSTRRAIRRWTSLVAATAACMPVATFIANAFPWYRGHHPRLQLALLVCGISVLAGVVALGGPWRRWMGGPTAFICMLTAAVIGLDVVHGSDLQFLSMLGLQPVYGGRYYGMGNVAFALLATSSLLYAAIVAGPLTRGHRAAHGLAALTVVVVGAAAVLVDGYPGWGADGGGPAALIPAFGYLAINAAGKRLTFLRITLISVVTGVFVGGAAVLDYLRGPERRTHLGEVVAGLRTSGTFGSVERIWQANWTMLTSSPLAMCVPLIVLLFVWALVRPNSWPGRTLRPFIAAQPFLERGLAAIVVTWMLGFFLNDSGTAIPPAGAMLLVPLLILLRNRVSPEASARHRRRARRAEVTAGPTAEGAETREGDQRAAYGS